LKQVEDAPFLGAAILRKRAVWDVTLGFEKVKPSAVIRVKVKKR
jgi:hypothetical protein